MPTLRDLVLPPYFGCENNDPGGLVVLGLSSTRFGGTSQAHRGGDRWTDGWYRGRYDISDGQMVGIYLGKL